MNTHSTPVLLLYIVTITIIKLYFILLLSLLLLHLYIIYHSLLFFIDTLLFLRSTQQDFNLVGGDNTFDGVCKFVLMQLQPIYVGSFRLGMTNMVKGYLYCVFAYFN